MHENEITELVNKEKNMETLAKRLAEAAFSNSNNRNKMSPFASKAKEHGLRHIGGKPDDITVITALINVKN